MDYRQSRTSYYADFILVPLLIIGAAIFCPGMSVLALVAGVISWTFAEYWIHREIFHYIFRRAHWVHHRRPHDFDAAPAWLTFLIHGALLAGLLYCFGRSLGGGFFAGLEIGYLAYIIVHDRIHHGKTRGLRWFKKLDRAHAIHHRGKEVNFGVVTHFWDRVFGTYDAT